MEPTNINDVCPMCRKVNKDLWVFVKLGERYKKICRSCRKDVDENSGANLEHYRKLKQDKKEAERKSRNARILREHNLKK